MGPEVRAVRLGGCDFVDQKQEVGQEQPIRDEIFIVPQAGLERWEGLLVVLQRVKILDCTSERQAESRQSSDCVRKLDSISLDRVFG